MGDPFHVTEKRQRERSRIVPQFAISAAQDDGTYVIRVEGELDLAGCPRLEHALREAEVSHAIRILLDLEELTFIDAAGLNVLVAAWHRSMTDSNRLRVTPGRGTVADMFGLTALDLVLPFSPARGPEHEDASAASSSRGRRRRKGRHRFDRSPRHQRGQRPERA